MAVRFWVCVLVLGLCILCDTRCKSYPTREQITKQMAENETAAEIAEKSITDPKARAVVVSALRTSAKMLKETDEHRASAEAARIAAESDAKKWRWLQFTACAAIVVGGLWWVKRKLS